MNQTEIIIIVAAVVIFIFLCGIRIVRPTHRGLVERLGKYKRFSKPGFNWIIPIIDRLFQINVTEVMVNAEPQEIITSDKLNARVDAQVYFQGQERRGERQELPVQRLRLPVPDGQPGADHPAQHHRHPDAQVGEQRTGKINSDLQKTMRDETEHWGIEIVRTELKEIDPPKDVQETMNKVVKAENEKVAAIDFATATETMADGARRAEIKKAEGIKQARRSSRPKARPRPSSS